jgi:hypothetical protein
MDQHRHSAPLRHSRRLVLLTLAGVAVGALVVGAVWWTSESGVLDAEASPEAIAGPSNTPSETSTEDDHSPSARTEIVVPTTAPADPTADPTAGNDPVLLLGDSLAVGIQYYVDAGLGDRVLTVDAAEGRGTAASVALLSPYAETSAPVWIVSLGTNDNPEEFEGQARSIMELAGPDRCVVWFDVWRDGTDDTINATLTELASKNPTMHLISWHEISSLHTDWFSGADVHPSSEGYAVRGQMAVDAVNEYCS